MGPESQLLLTKVLVIMGHTFGSGNVLFYTLLILEVLLLHVNLAMMSTCSLEVSSYCCLQRGAHLSFLLFRALVHSALLQSLENGCLSVCFCGRFFLSLVWSVGCWLPSPHGNEPGCTIYSYNSHLRMMCLCSHVTLPIMATEEHFRMLLPGVTSYWESHRDFCVSASAHPNPSNLCCCSLITSRSILCGLQKPLIKCEALERSITAVAAFSPCLTVWIFHIRYCGGDI